MAIGPNHLDGNFKKEVELFEKHIDAVLLKKTLPSTRRVTIDTPKGMTNDHLDVLSEKYIIAGWKFVHRSFGVQQDPGDWIIFEA